MLEPCGTAGTYHADPLSPVIHTPMSAGKNRHGSVFGWTLEQEGRPRKQQLAIFPLDIPLDLEQFLRRDLGPAGLTGVDGGHGNLSANSAHYTNAGYVRHFRHVRRMGRDDLLPGQTRD